MSSRASWTSRQFKDKLVLIGVTALALSDNQATPVGDRMAGVEIHAQLIEGIFDGELLTRPWWTIWLEAAVLAVAGLILIAAVPALPVIASAGLAVLLAAAAVALGLGLYFEWRILFDAAVPVLGMGLLFTAMLGTTLADAEAQRRALRRQVARQREAAARLAGELEAARRIQMGSLPSPGAAFPEEARFDLYAYLEPAREVGGDLYDFFKLDADRIFLLVGDVSGKGLPGSLFMTVSKSLCKSIALRVSGDLGSVMREADREISRDNAEGLFVTISAAIVNATTGEVRYGSAGHDAPVPPVARDSGPEPTHRGRWAAALCARRLSLRSLAVSDEPRRDALPGHRWRDGRHERDRRVLRPRASRGAARRCRAERRAGRGRRDDPARHRPLRVGCRAGR